jgi:serine protease Do
MFKKLLKANNLTAMENLLMRMIQFSLVLFITLLSFTHAHASDLWVEQDSKTEIIPVSKLPSFATAIDLLGKSVVNIRTKGKVKVSARNPFSGGQDPWEQLFGNMPKKNTDRPFRSLGSGFVIHPDGYIVTNEHVVSRADRITISFRDDKKTYTAKLIGSDKKTDLALLKVDYPGKLPAAPLGDSEQLLPGDWVMAIGNPFHLGHTATVGIVSAKSRRINIPGEGSSSYANYIQTDASINPGNSGGPLFNTKGEVIGVNTAIFSPGASGPSGFNIGIGFAIPINQVKGIITQLREEGSVTRGWLGVLIQPVDPDLAEALELDGTNGSLVADVIEDSPAAKAGFRNGDLILTFDGKEVVENDDLPFMVANTKVGKRVSVGIIRDGRKKSLKVKIEELKEAQGKEEEEPQEEEVEYQLGLSVQELSPEIARTLGLKSEKGVIVADIVPDSPAAESGLRRGDIILRVGSDVVESANGLRSRLRNVKKGAPVLFFIQRKGSTIFLTLKKE